MTMAAAEDNLKRLIRLVGRQDRQNLAVAVGTVQNIDEDKRICEIEVDDELTLFNCRLNAVIDTYTDHLLIVPKEGSAVAFLSVGGNLTDTVIIAYSEVEKVLLTIGETTISIIDGKIEINGGDNGGMCNTPELKTQLDKLTARVDGIIDALKNGTTGTQDGGAAYKASVVAALQALTDKENFNDIEDTKITH